MTNSSKMTYFSAMTDGELNTYIAKKLGWSVLKHNDKKYYVFAPNSICSMWWSDTEDSAWLSLHHWVLHIDRALSLINTKIWNVDMHIGYEMSECSLDDGAHTYWANAAPDKLARAICVAWCKMMEEENGK